MKVLQKSILVVRFAMLASCTTGGPDDDAVESTDELRSGSVTTERPQVGRLSLPRGGNTSVTCTGALVGPHTVLTAAHCVQFRTTPIGGASATFTVHSSVSSSSWAHHVDAFRSYGDDIGKNDVALVHLSDPVTGLAPLRLRASEPARGELVRLYGYGIHDCEPASTGGHLDGKKRVYAYRWGETTHAICDGDSGGPTVTSAGISQVISYTVNYFFTDGEGFGRVWPLYNALQAQIEAWE